MNDIAENLARVRDNIAEAAFKSGREPSDVKLIGVTKTIDADRIRVLLDLGVTSLGENKPQELAEKYQILGIRPEWHLIGHLQTNKVKYIVDKAKLIQSVDSFELAKEIDKQAGKIGKTQDILIELNISGEESKFGAAPEGSAELIKRVGALENVSVQGLMVMAPFTGDTGVIRDVFKRGNEIFALSDVRGTRLQTLSMGMSGDFEIAVEEGANMVRVGRGIFG